MKIFNFLKKRRKIVVLAILIIVALLIGFRIFFGKGKKPQYQTTKVERGTIVWSVSASGSVVTANIFEVTTQASGMVKKIYVNDGDKVKVGQKIMEIEPDLAGKQKAASAWSSYLSAKNNLDSAKAALYSLDSAMWKAHEIFMDDAVERDLSKDDPIYIQENDDWLAAEAKYKNQEAVIAQAEQAVNNSWLSYQLVSPIITAPVSGTIFGLAYVPGMAIGSSSTTTGQRVAVIRTEGAPIASFNLSELDVPVVKTGQKATIKLDSLPEKTFTGKVVSVDKLGTMSNGVTNYPVIVQFDTAPQDVLPNMAASVNIIIETKDNVLLVPSSAIQKKAGQNLVTILEKGKERQKRVEVGISSETQTEIISGLSEGETVVVSKISGATIQPSRSPFGGMPGGTFRMAR